MNRSSALTRIATPTTRIATPVTRATVSRGMIRPAGFVHIEDYFTDSDATNLVDHTPTPTIAQPLSWKQDGTEDMVITSNQATSANTTGALKTYSVVDTLNEDMTVEATITHTDTSNVSVQLMARYIDKQNYIAILQKDFFGVAYALDLVEVRGGVITTLQTLHDASSLSGIEMQMTLTCTQTSITATVVADGNTYTHTETNAKYIRGTRAGIYCGTANAVVDNFKITQV